jgi:glycosyltransferase involved in cell wall biosynthesis
MRIVIDMQGAQSESRFRGIGRYTMSFVQAVVRNRGDHEIILALSGLFSDTIEPIRAAFEGLLPQENIRVWYAPGPVREHDPENAGRREVAELLREAFLASLRPDVIHVCSLFEGYVDDAVVSIGRFDTKTPVSVILYDLIPLLNPETYLRSNPQFESYYLRKVSYLRLASRLLAISDFTRHEGLAHLDIPEEKAVTIYAATESYFQQQNLDEGEAADIKKKFGICRPFILCTGGSDERKNLPRLIEAYAALPKRLRGGYQLLFAGKMPESHAAQFKQIARGVGLGNDELIFTDFVSDKDLLQLYNLCELYVFPSWHEGFGLPALEAMACGAPVIGAITSSLPEVIGLADAMFDPFDVVAISQKMTQALEDGSFRNRLRKNGLQQSKNFSWDETARRSIEVWASHTAVDCEGYIERAIAGSHLNQVLAKHLARAAEHEILYVSACLALNEQGGMERQLLVDVSELCQRDAATGVQRVVRSYLKWLLDSPPAGFRVEPVYATRETGYRYARGFACRFIGQSDTSVSDDPMGWQRGDIFFGLDMQHHVQLAHATFYRRLIREGVVVKFLVHDLLPIQLAELFKDSDAKILHEHWLSMIANTDGAICVSKATANALVNWIDSAAITSSPSFQTCWVHIGADISGSKASKGLPDDAASILKILRQRLTFLCVSTVEPRKGQNQILEATESIWNDGLDINLVFVGKEGWKIEDLAERLRVHPELGHRLFWLQGISDEYLEQVYAASTCLIAASLNEGFGLPLIEAARHGIPIIARDIDVFREVAGEHAFYFQGSGTQDLASALKSWMNAHSIQVHPTSDGISWSTWQQSAEKLKRALISQNYPRQQLLVDISELVQHDANTGIQRVVRSVLKEWLLNPPIGYRVEPVYATVEHCYYYARQFTQRFLNMDEEVLMDEPINFAPGDVFFGMDLNHHVPQVHKLFLQQMRQHGVDVRFMIYDLLPIQFPEHFESRHLVDVMTEWLSVVTGLDGAVCISKTVADDLAQWMKANGSARFRPFAIDWFHLGADADTLHISKELPSEAKIILGQLNMRPSFLMVGTLEPRKAHAQVLDAFELLWRDDIDANLVIVGKKGWMVEELVERLRTHSELNNRLFWLGGISDEYLEKVYLASTCLIAASYGEGFGLPLIEAAQHKLPIIARDIPVFREVAKDHVYYFSDDINPSTLMLSVRDWLNLFRRGKHPKSDNMPWLTWKESAMHLREIILQREFI